MQEDRTTRHLSWRGGLLFVAAAGNLVRVD